MGEREGGKRIGNYYLMSCCLSFFLDYLELSSRIISDFSNFENKLDYSDREKKYLDWVVSSKEYLIDSINQSRFLKENK